MFHPFKDFFSTELFLFVSNNDLTYLSNAKIYKIAMFRYSLKGERAYLDMTCNITV